VDRDPYTHLADRFVAHYDSLGGALRYELLARQLDEHLPAVPVSIVDVGGGAGHQAIRLARAGNDVTPVDPSADMLDRAERSIAQEAPEVRARLQLVKATAAEAPQVLGGRRYEAVVCHAVLPYVQDAQSLIVTLARLAVPGTLLSLVFKNADALAMRPALEGRWSQAMPAFEATEDVGGLSVSTRAHRRSELEPELSAAGFECLAWYGIRVMSDHLADAPTVRLDEVLPVESEAARRDPYRALGRLIHLVAARRA
jgi:S-adenosylmethionine-dependent methyltransferase